MKVIYLCEDAFHKLMNIEDVPFLTFYESVTLFIKGLLKDPISTKPNETLCSMGLYNGVLRQKLIEYDVIDKSEDIDEPYDEATHRKTSRYHLQYKVHRSNFKNKLRRLYNEYIEKVNKDEQNN